MSDPQPPTKSELVRILIGSGFTFVAAGQKPNYLTIEVSRTELLGVRISYLIAFTCCAISSHDVASLMAEAEERRATLVIVGQVVEETTSVPVLTYPQFSDRLGGGIFSLLPFEPEFGARLVKLGDNKLPKGLSGKPDDLFEEYVHAGLQFLFRGRVVRYGQERRGEPVPDGVVLAENAPLFLYDAKAAGDGYEMSMDAVRQFSDYVLEFHKLYERTVGRLSAFLVISGKFADSEEVLERRSREVLAKCQVPLAFLDAKTFGGIVKALVNQPLFRQSVDWGLVFARPVVRVQDVNTSLRARQRDAVLPAAKK
jgi:hypothetical protein